MWWMEIVFGETGRVLCARPMYTEEDMRRIRMNRKVYGREHKTR